MNIHEHQAKLLLSQYNVPVPKGHVAFNLDELKAGAAQLETTVKVVKAQIHAGGRGKAGGVKLVRSSDEIRAAGEELFGKTLVTPQTGPEGKKVRRLYVEAGCDIEKEFYFSIVIDRDNQCNKAIASAEGGVDIEEVAEKTPDAIHAVSIAPTTGAQGYQGRQLAFAMGLSGKQVSGFVKFFMAAYNAFVQLDADMLEVNPLVLTKQGDFLALDAKMSFDDNALYRHPDIQDMRDPHEQDPREREAEEAELSYIKLDGNIGCMVNGAGLAMATMDVIKLHGAAPANFLDVGGGAPKERVATAFKLILSDPHVKGILVNIFGGIMRCDIIAEGILAAAEEVNLSVPLVVRLEGTNVEKGKEILANSTLSIVSADDLGDAAHKIVQAVKK
ncbi:ADP-forming succinate--CoA ligase subunit beta [Alphaproteobacteria bacterium]|nr:ADP-forming succinate--CoA ligase subunit beta [Alphaproteobacteria bacterium]